VPWDISLAAPDLTATTQDRVSGSVATLAAAGYIPSAVTATIDWGDRTSGPATVTGTALTETTINSLDTVTGSHSYAQPGAYQAMVTVTAKAAQLSRRTSLSTPHCPATIACRGSARGHASAVPAVAAGVSLGSAEH